MVTYSLSMIVEFSYTMKSYSRVHNLEQKA